jgi:hypothetical protein
MLFFVLSIFVLLLVGCFGGIKNATPLEASQTMMAALTEGDVDQVAKVNMSDAWSYPADHMINLANEKNLVGKDPNDLSYKELEEQFVKVSWMDNEGDEHVWYLKFNQTNKGYFFVKIDNFDGELLDK